MGLHRVFVGRSCIVKNSYFVPLITEHWNTRTEGQVESRA